MLLSDQHFLSLAPLKQLINPRPIKTDRGSRARRLRPADAQQSGSGQLARLEELLVRLDHGYFTICELLLPTMRVLNRTGSLVAHGADAFSPRHALRCQWELFTDISDSGSWWHAVSRYLHAHSLLILSHRTLDRQTELIQVPF